MTTNFVDISSIGHHNLASILVASVAFVSLMNRNDLISVYDDGPRGG